MLDAKKMRGAVGSVIANAGNYPEPVQLHLLGRDLSEVIDKAVEVAMKVAAEVIAEKDSRIAALEERVQDRRGW